MKIGDRAGWVGRAGQKLRAIRSPPKKKLSGRAHWFGCGRLRCFAMIFFFFFFLSATLGFGSGVPPWARTGASDVKLCVAGGSAGVTAVTFALDDNSGRATSGRGPAVAGTAAPGIAGARL